MIVAQQNQLASNLQCSYTRIPAQQHDYILESHVDLQILYHSPQRSATSVGVFDIRIQLGSDWI